MDSDLRFPDHQGCIPTEPLYCNVVDPVVVSSDRTPASDVVLVLQHVTTRQRPQDYEESPRWHQLYAALHDTASASKRRR